MRCWQSYLCALAALCCACSCLHPVLGLELQQLQLSKCVVRCLPSLLTTAAGTRYTK